MFENSSAVLESLSENAIVIMDKELSSDILTPQPGDFWMRGDERWYIFQDKNTGELMMMVNSGDIRSIDMYMIDGRFGWKRTYPLSGTRERLAAARKNLEFELGNLNLV